MIGRSGGLWTMIPILGLAACGKPNIEPFLGTWAVSGNGNVSCTGTNGPESQSGGGNPTAAQYKIAFAAGTSADLISLDSMGCQLLWNVNGNKATLEPGQTCEFAFAYGPPSVIAMDSQSTITLTTTTDQNTLSGTGNIHGTLSGSNVDGASQSMSCKASAIGTLVRAGN